MLLLKTWIDVRFCNNRLLTFLSRSGLLLAAALAGCARETPTIEIPVTHATPKKQVAQSPALIGQRTKSRDEAGDLSRFITSRSTSDRPDDFPGYQIHVMYVLPNDGVDRHLDTNGTIAFSVAAIQKWFVGQTHGRRSLRFDTSNGRLDITFFRLARTDAKIASFVGQVRDQIEVDLKAAGFNDPKKLYAVYYDGSSTFACGGGAWPPTLPGNVAALYLRGTPDTPDKVPPCVSNPFARSDLKPHYWEFSLLHEIFHTLGAVADCAPHFTMDGHVSDDRRDLMYAGKLVWPPSIPDGGPVILDVGHDDYFNHGNKNCLDLARSAFIDPTGPDSAAPSEWQSHAR